jgi:hypothetical protein
MQQTLMVVLNVARFFVIYNATDSWTSAEKRKKWGFMWWKELHEK